jgi:hypothetical protein
VNAIRLHRPFFSSAIVCTLTVGTGWGAYLLWQISEAGSFTAVSLHLINAHGHAQVFGWVGLFIMGFTLQILPRFLQTKVWGPSLVDWVFGLMIVGILGRLVGGYYWDAAWGRLVGQFGSVSEIVAVALFVLIVVRTVRQSLSPVSVIELYILASLFWLTVAVVFSAVHFAITVGAPSRPALLQQVATWQAPLRDVQIIGFALVMILGVSQRILPGVYRTEATDSRKSLTVLILVNLAVLLAVVAHPVFISTGSMLALVVRGAAGLLLFVSVAWLIIPWRLWRLPKPPDRSAKFISTAFGWLLASLTLTLLTPLYSGWSDMAFSHAYFGAARHAITVGFVSQMILGVAARVVPFLQGLNAKDLPSLRSVYALINVGCSLRVILQIATDHAPAAFQLIAVSGLLELTAIAVWGVHLIRLMYSRPSPPFDSHRGISGGMRVRNKIV